MPVIAILRGVEPGEVVEVGDALFEAGIRIIEVPMNSPEPLASVRALAEHLGDRCVIGAGAVLSTTEVDQVVDAGGQLIVSPNTEVAVIEGALQKACVPVPGVATATEALHAYAHGARFLKLFPAGTYGTAHVVALRAVLPENARLLAVGGVAATNASEWMRAGVGGVGIGTEIYRPGDTAAMVHSKATAVAEAIAAGND